MKVRLLKDWQGRRAGEVVEVTKNEAFGLVDSGRARPDKMLTEYHTGAQQYEGLPRARKTGGK